MNHTNQQETPITLKEDEFSALQMMAFIFLLHKKNDKAGVILKTLHHIAPQNQNVRLSLTFVLSEFELFQEAKEMLAPLLENNSPPSIIINLLQTKLMLAQEYASQSSPKVLES